jgi:hypothetical protein
MLKWVITKDQIPEQQDSVILIHYFMELVQLFLPLKVLCHKICGPTQKKETNPSAQESRRRGETSRWL